jgi:hypothetical protein
MSIQSTINQGISLMSLLVSQTGTAAKRRTEKQVEAEKPLREAEYAHKERLEEIKTAGANERERLRIQSEKDEREEKRAEKIGLAKSHYEATAGLVVPYRLTGTKGDAVSGAMLESQIASRAAAIEAAQSYYDLEPSDEVRDRIGGWRDENTALENERKARRTRKEAAERRKIKAEGAAEERSRMADVAKAERSAAEAAAVEEHRLAISRSITEGVYSTDPAFDPRFTGGRK